MTRPDALPVHDVMRAVRNYGALSEQLGELCGDADTHMLSRAIQAKQARVTEALAKVEYALAAHVQAAVREAVAKVHVSRAEWDELLDRLTWRDEHGDQHAVTDVANAFLNRCTVTEEASRNE